MLTDIEIAQQSRMRDITEIADKLGIREDRLEFYGHYKTNEKVLKGSGF